MAIEFAIDGIEMPRPSDWLVNPKPMSSDAERLIGSGKMVIPYLTTAYEVTWTYKYLSSAEYDLIYDTYIRKTTINKSFYHTLTTKDSNSDNILELDIYTQSDFTAPLYRIKDGVRYYKDVKFTFVSLGGEE
jgi:hypothetical protein